MSEKNLIKICKNLATAVAGLHERLKTVEDDLNKVMLENRELDQRVEKLEKSKNG